MISVERERKSEANGFFLSNDGFAITIVMRHIQCKNCNEEETFTEIELIEINAGRA